MNSLISARAQDKCACFEIIFFGHVKQFDVNNNNLAATGSLFAVCYLFFTIYLSLISQSVSQNV